MSKFSTLLSMSAIYRIMGFIKLAARDDLSGGTNVNSLRVSSFC